MRNLLRTRLLQKQPEQKWSLHVYRAKAEEDEEEEVEGHRKLGCT
jgi:hypothetical protein